MANVRAIPEGYHSVTPYLNITGAAAAIEFYKKAFGAEERFRMPSPDGKVMHAELKIGDSLIGLADASRDPATQSMILLYTTDCDAAFNRAVTAGAKVKMPLTDMFWGDRFGSVTDPYGNTWSIATHKEDVAPEELEKRSKAFAAQMGNQKVT